MNPSHVKIGDLVYFYATKRFFLVVEQAPFYVSGKPELIGLTCKFFDLVSGDFFSYKINVYGSWEFEVASSLS